MKLLIAGDFCPNNRVVSLIENGEYERIFGHVANVIQSADYSIVNFETTIANSSDKPIKKCGPALCTKSYAIDALAYAGFDCCTLANNHFKDFGEEGIMRSISELEKKHFEYFGAGSNLYEAQKVLIKEINHKKIAFINCCEHEFSKATDKQAGCKPLDPISLYYSIKEAKELADFVIMIIHGGLEHIQVPQIRMKRLYHFFVDIGVDVIINHHQHCVNGMEVYNNKPIFYGLGNFCFDWEGKIHSIWNVGYMVKLNISNTIDYEVVPYSQCDDKPCVRLLEGKEKKSFEIEFKRLSDLISDDAAIAKNYDDFLTNNITRYKYIFEPYWGRLGAKLYSRKLLPSFAKIRSTTKLNFIECESHREMLISLLNKLIIK